MVESLIERLRAYPRDKNGNFDILAYTLDGNEAADRIEAIERELAEGKRRNAELDREITGLRNSYWEERKAHLAAEADKARLSEAADFLCDRMDEFDRDINDDADSTAYHGHVAPAKSRLRAALSGSSSGWRECATEGCTHAATVRFERGGVGSDYCHACYMRIQALPAAPQHGRE